MGVENLTGLEKPLEKLVETVSEGIGVLSNHIFEFDAKRIKRIGKAKAKADKEKIIAKAEGQEGALEILTRAEKRFALEQYSKQINLENILFKTKKDLAGKHVSENPVEKDWTSRFLEIAQNVSREEVQNVLARILSGEIQEPGSFSYQTLSIIKHLSRKELDLFIKMLSISTNLGIIKLDRSEDKFLAEYGFVFSNYLDLSAIGLLSQTSNLVEKSKIQPNKSLLISVGQDSIKVTHSETKEKEIKLDIYALSKAGQELRPLLLELTDKKLTTKFRDALINKIESIGFQAE